MSFKLWLIKSQRLDHTQTHFHSLQREFVFIWHQETSCAPSVPCHPSLNHQHWAGAVWRGPWGRLYNSFILTPALPIAFCNLRTYRSLSHLVGGPGPQNPQGRDIITVVSNILPACKDSNNKRNLSIVCSVLALNGRRNSAAKKTLGKAPFLPHHFSIDMSSAT